MTETIFNLKQVDDLNNLNTYWLACNHPNLPDEQSYYLFSVHGKEITIYPCSASYQVCSNAQDVDPHKAKDLIQALCTKVSALHTHALCYAATLVNSCVEFLPGQWWYCASDDYYSYYPGYFYVAPNSTDQGYLLSGSYLNSLDELHELSVSEVTSRCVQLDLITERGIIDYLNQVLADKQNAQWSATESKLRSKIADLETELTEVKGKLGKHMYYKLAAS